MSDVISNSDDSQEQEQSKIMRVSYKQMLRDNIDCLRLRLVSSQNPFLNEFNLVYQGLAKRLPLFELVTSQTNHCHPTQDDLSYHHNGRDSEYH